MEIRKGKKFDAYAVQFQTTQMDIYSKDIIKCAMAFLTDHDKAGRKKKLECKACYYMRTSRIGGAAMTQVACGICDKVIMYGSTNTDAMCRECAEKYQLCVYCGADQELRPRRVVKFD